MTRIIYIFLLFCGVFTNVLSQPVDYTVRVTQTQWFENGVGGSCQEGGDEEYSARAWFHDNLNGTNVGGNCITCTTNGNCTNNTDFTLGSRSNTCASSVILRFQAWEDDRGGRCDLNINGGVFDNDDDCHCGASNVATINFRNNGPGCNTYGYYGCNQNNHRFLAEICWNYSAGAPTNTTCGNATTAGVGATAYTLPGTTCGTDITSCTTNDNDALWYAYTPQCSYSATFSTCVGTTYDAALSVWSACTSGQLACNDDACGLQSSITLNVTGGTTYYIRVSGNNSASGAGTLTISTPPMPALNGGSVAASQLICQGTIPTAFTNTGSASGGTGTLNYQWEQQANCTGVFSNIGGATGLTYSPPALNLTTCYRRKVTDGCGTISYSNTLTITVDDVTPPVITCPGPQTLNTDINCEAVLPSYINLATTSDNCVVASVTQSPSVGTTINASTDVTLTVTDGNGLTATCMFGVTLVDNLPPSITCPTPMMQTADPGVCGATITYSITSSDNCPGEMITQTAGLASGAVFPVGTTTNEFVVTDVGNNTATCSFDVIITDDEDPVLVCNPTTTVQLDPSNNAIVTANDLIGSSSDNCGIPVVQITNGQTNYDCNDVGQSFTLDLLATDAVGNTISCQSIVTVADDDNPCNLPPTAECQNLVVTANSNCQGVVSASDFDDGSVDPEMETLTFSVIPAGPYPIGTTNVVLTVTDPQGASDDCTASILVNEGTSLPIPTFDCPSPTLPKCNGTFACNFNDQNASTVNIVTASVSGSAAVYLQGDYTPGGNAFFDPLTMPDNVPLTLVYTLTVGNCTSSTTVCTFTVATSNQSSAGGF